MCVNICVCACKEGKTENLVDLLVQPANFLSLLLTVADYKLSRSIFAVPLFFCLSILQISRWEPQQLLR